MSLVKIAETYGYFESQRIANKAMRRSDKGIGKLIADPELVKMRVRKGLAEGGRGLAAGAALGGGAGLLYRLATGKRHTLKSAVLGALAGGLIGNAVGQVDADREYLANKGIKLSRSGLFVEK